MALTFIWAGKDENDWNNVIGASSYISFNGAGFDSPIWVNDRNDETHIKSSTTGLDGCPAIGGATKHLSNLKRIDPGGGTDNVVSVDGGANTTLNALALAGRGDFLRITVSNVDAFSVLGAKVYAYDSVTVTTPPPNLTFYSFDGNLDSPVWQAAGGRNSAINFAARTSATSHHFYFGISVQPLSTGSALQFAIRFEIDIQ